MDLTTELRWLVRPNGNLRLDGTVVVHDTERVLQYRTKVNVNVNVYAGMPDVDFVNRTANMQWSTWIDVPEYKEEL